MADVVSSSLHYLYRFDYLYRWEEKILVCYGERMDYHDGGGDDGKTGE